MKKIILIFTIVFMTTSCSVIKQDWMNRKIDASSKEALENSISAIERKAREEDFKEFKNAYQAMVMKKAVENELSGVEIDFDMKVNAIFNGKTPNEIITIFKKK